MRDVDTRPTPVAALTELIGSIQRKAQQRAASTLEPARDAKAKVNMGQLGCWGEPVRAVPNPLLRTALFGAIAKGKRRYIEGELLAAVDRVELRYTGQRLDQGDLDVWVSVLHAVRLQELGSQCRVTSYALLKLMGRTDTGKNRATLHKRITRLRSGTVELTVELARGRYVYIGGLIGEASKDEETQEWVIELNPKLRPLFAADQFTQVEWAVRHALDGHQLAQWLHCFYASHAKPFPMRMDTLLTLAGSEDANPRSAQQTLRKALKAVTEASKSHGEGFSYKIIGNLVHVGKRGSGPQRRHLATKIARIRQRLP